MSISSQAATQASQGSCRISSNQNLDAVVSDLVDTITMQLSSLDANQAAVTTQQARSKLAAEVEMDYVHLHDGVHNHPKSSQAKPLIRRSLRDVSNVLKTSLQQLMARSPLARDRSFKIKPRKSALGMYQPLWVSGATAARRSVSTAGENPREN